MKHRLSVVSICFNNLADLQTTIRSVSAQRRLPYEHLIIDGSTDGLIKNFLENNPHPPYIRWFSEPDEGISDAFNKGIARAKGDIVHLLNAGDYYYQNTATAAALEAFEKDTKLQWLHGKYVQFRGGSWVISGTPFSPRLLYRGMRQTGHPTFFVKKEVYKKCGGFKPTLKIAMDYDLLMRIAGEKFLFLPTPLTVFTPGGISNREINQSLRETRKIYESYRGISPKCRLWMLRTALLAWFTQKTIPGKILFRQKNRQKVLTTPLAETSK